jgi:predicted nicotinamide N-methyase
LVNVTSGVPVDSRVTTLPWQALNTVPQMKIATRTGETYTLKIDTMHSRSELILKHTQVVQFSENPKLQLHLAREYLTIWQALEVYSGHVEAPPFWAHAWSGGVALMNFAFQNAHAFKGKRVLDFASGCGISAIAAAQCGAMVTATEIDEWAIASIELNSALNGVSMETKNKDVIGNVGGFDVLLIGDVFYEKELSVRVTQWIFQCAKNGIQVLVGDVGRHFFPREKMKQVASYKIQDTPNWDSVSGKDVGIWTCN